MHEEIIIPDKEKVAKCTFSCFSDLLSKNCTRKFDEYYYSVPNILAYKRYKLLKKSKIIIESSRKIKSQFTLFIHDK